MLTKIMLIRHAEKPAEQPPPHGVGLYGDHDRKALSVRGWIRAGALVGLFAPTNGVFASPALATPNLVYAEATGPTAESLRPQQTVIPLLEKLGARAVADNRFARGQESEMVASALEKDGVALICWDHAHLPRVAECIPLSANNKTPAPTEWDNGRFDLVWVFDREEGVGGFIFSQVGQRVLAGDL